MPTVVKQDERNLSFFWSRIIFDALKKSLERASFGKRGRRS